MVVVYETKGKSNVVDLLDASVEIKTLGTAKKSTIPAGSCNFVIQVTTAVFEKLFA